MRRTGKRITKISVLLFVAAVVSVVAAPKSDGALGILTGFGLILGAIGLIIGPGLWMLGAVLGRGDRRNAPASPVSPEVAVAGDADVQDTTAQMGKRPRNPWVRGRTKLAIVLTVLVVILAVVLPSPLVREPHLWRIEASRAVPATLITLDATRIDPSLSTTVEFSDDHGFKLDVRAISVNGINVRVTVPPYVDRATHKFGSGIVQVRIVQQRDAGPVATNSLDLIIDPLPVVDAAPGVVTLAALGVIVELAPGVNFRLSEAHNAHPSWSTGASAAAIAEAAAAMGDLRGAVLMLASRRADAVDLGTFAGRRFVLTRDDLPRLDQLMAAWFLALGPHSPSPCAAADRYTDAMLHDQEFGVALDQAAKDSAAGVLTCGSSQILELGERTAGWLGVLALLATGVGEIVLPIQALATMAYIPIAAATTSLIMTAQSVALTGGVKEDAVNALQAIDLFQSTIVDGVLSGAWQALVPAAHGLLYDGYTSARFLMEETGRLRGTAETELAPSVVLVAPSVVPVAPSVVPVAPSVVPVAPPVVSVAPPIVPVAPPVAHSISANPSRLNITIPHTAPCFTNAGCTEVATIVITSSRSWHGYCASCAFNFSLFPVGLYGHGFPTSGPAGSTTVTFTVIGIPNGLGGTLSFGTDDLDGTKVDVPVTLILGPP